MLSKSERRSSCPVACTLDIIGDRWTLLVIRDLFFGKRYFDEFLGSPEGIATNILSARLASLARLKLVRRVADEKDRRRVSYELTDKGRTLESVLRATAQWGMEQIHGKSGPLTMGYIERSPSRTKLSPKGERK